MWAQEAFPVMFTFKMLQGNADALEDPSSILLAESVAKALFNTADPLNQTVRIDNKMEMKVAGVYEDLPYNTTYRDVKLLLPWERYVNGTEEWIKNAQTQWDNHMCQLYVQLNDNADIDKVSAKINGISVSTCTSCHLSFKSLLGTFDHCTNKTRPAPS